MDMYPINMMMNFMSGQHICLMFYQLCRLPKWLSCMPQTQNIGRNSLICSKGYLMIFPFLKGRHFASVDCSSSMIAIIIDLVWKEMHMEICHRTPTENQVPKTDGKARPNTSFRTPSVLELVEFVLRPPQGRRPSLPEQGDAVLSALNLYGFADDRIYTSSLQKAYHEWLLPLPSLLTGIMSGNKNDHDQLAIDNVCSLNPLELVLYRCIELLEEKLNQSA